MKENDVLWYSGWFGAGVFSSVLALTLLSALSGKPIKNQPPALVMPFIGIFFSILLSVLYGVWFALRTRKMQNNKRRYFYIPFISGILIILILPLVTAIAFGAFHIELLGNVANIIPPLLIIILPFVMCEADIVILRKIKR